MKVHQQTIKANEEIDSISLDFNPNLILCFISPNYKMPKEGLDLINEKFKKAIFIGCSTSGEIMDTSVSDETISFTAVEFEKTVLDYCSFDITSATESFDVGKSIAERLKQDDLKHIIVLSDGLNVNGADLVNGITGSLDSKISVTGGLAGDGADFNSTFIVDNGKITPNKVCAIGLISKDLKIGFGSQGGWDSFGIERLVTKSDNNVLYELDGKPALDLYKSFLGEKANELPGSGLLFPLSMRDENSDTPVVRTILGVNEEDNSLTFAGNIPEGAYVRLMKANIDRLIIGAESSAKISQGIIKEEAQLAILISCVGRRLVLKQLVEEEVEAVKDVLGEQAKITGFYSYGELAPFGKFQSCQLHNQTMTITTFAE